MAKKIIHVAVAVIKRISPQHGPQILISKRHDHLHQGGLWEFPGGKVEQGETVQLALQRELEEELGIVIRLDTPTLSPLIQITHDYGDKAVLLDVWELDMFDGIPHGKEGQPVEWVEVKELPAYEFPAANVPILNAVLLPDSLPITPSNANFETLEKAIAGYVSEGFPACVVRCPEKSASDYIDVYRRLVTLFSKQIDLIAHGDPRHLKTLAEREVNLHLPSAVATQVHAEDLTLFRSVSMSCHNLEELEHAETLGCQFAFLSPVNRTASHPDKEGIGWDQFAELVAKAKVPVFALGGVGSHDIANAKSRGAQGVAGISSFLE